MTQHTVQGNGFTLALDDHGHITALRRGGRALPRPVAVTTYELDGKTASAELAAGGEAPALGLTAGAAAARLTFVPGREIALRLAAEGEVKQVGLTLFLPGETVLHLAENRNIGRRLDGDMPPGEVYRCRLNFNFLLADVGGLWLRLKTNHRKYSEANGEIFRFADAFRVTLTWNPEADATLALFDTLDDAVADYRQWMESTFPVLPLAARANAPDWVYNTKLVITADMLRPNWEITHDYNDVTGLATALKEAGCPADTLIYIPGWHGAYDSTHPTYWPRPELGGEDAFRRMVDTIHRCGFRVMTHSTGWGIDPYHPDIDQLERLVARWPDGTHRGWQTNDRQYPGKHPLKYTLPKTPLGAPQGRRTFTFETPPIPAWCEALFTLGGMKVGDGRVKISLGRRFVNSPPRWFAHNDAYDYPFPLELREGANTITVEVSGDGEPDWSGAWYAIRYAFFPTSPYASWTWPILVADMQHPDYIALMAANMKKFVTTFGIDAAHVDATFIDGQFAELGQPRALLHTLRDTLAPVPLCGESATGYEDFGIFVFTQAATQSLTRAALAKAPGEQGSLPMREGVAEVFAWLTKPSPVCEFAKAYTRSYPHLCAANAFVPVGKVCNIFPPRKMPTSDAEQWGVLREARAMGYVPGLRVNFRRYGLDTETAKAVRELGQ